MVLASLFSGTGNKEKAQGCGEKLGSIVWLLSPSPSAPAILRGATRAFESPWLNWVECHAQLVSKVRRAWKEKVEIHHSTVYTELRKSPCTWFGEVCLCCSLTALPGPAWVLLKYVLRRLFLSSVLRCFPSLPHSLRLLLRFLRDLQRFKSARPPPFISDLDRLSASKPPCNDFPGFF